MRKQQKSFLFWILIILLLAFVMNVVEKKGNRLVKTINYSEFVKAVDENQIREVVFQGENTIQGTFVEGYENGAAFELTGTTSEVTFNILREKGITPNYKKEEKQGLLSTIFINWFPMILLFVIFFFFLRQLQSGGGKAMSFGKSKAKMLNESDKKVNFTDVSGVEEAKEELVEVVDFLKDPKKYTKLGGKIPNGVFLV